MGKAGGPHYFNKVLRYVLIRVVGGRKNPPLYWPLECCGVGGLLMRTCLIRRLGNEAINLSFGSLALGACLPLREAGRKDNCRARDFVWPVRALIKAF